MSGKDTFFCVTSRKSLRFQGNFPRWLQKEPYFLCPARGWLQRRRDYCCSSSFTGSSQYPPMTSHAAWPSLCHTLVSWPHPFSRGLVSPRCPNTGPGPEWASERTCWVGAGCPERCQTAGPTWPGGSQDVSMAAEGGEQRAQRNEPLICPRGAGTGFCRGGAQPCRPLTVQSPSSPGPADRRQREDHRLQGRHLHHDLQRGQRRDSAARAAAEAGGSGDEP